MGLPPMTEAAQSFTALLPNAAKGVADMGNAVKDTSKGLKDVNKSYSQAMIGSAQDAKNLGKEQMAAMSMTGGANAEAAMQAQKNANLLNSKQVRSAEDFDKLQQEIATSQKAREQSTAAQAAETEQAFKNLSAEFMATLMPVIKELTPVIQDLAQKMIQFAKENMPAIKAGLEMVVNFVKDLFSPEGREKVGKQIAEGLGKLLQMAWDSFSLFGKKNQPDADSAAYNSTGYDSGSIPGAADGGIVKAKPGGQLIKAAEVGKNEAFVPLPDGNKIPVNLDMKMPDFKSIISNELSSFAAAMQQMETEKTKSSPGEDMFASIKESIFGKSETKTDTAVDAPSKDLLTELQQLNKQTAQMLAYMRDSTDFSRRNLDAIRGLNGNLLI
jgi:molecular chaperone GrpE (heat shock protein)